jgi:hypothetical protein
MSVLVSNLTTHRIMIVFPELVILLLVLIDLARCCFVRSFPLGFAGELNRFESGRPGSWHGICKIRQELPAQYAQVYVYPGCQCLCVTQRSGPPLVQAIRPIETKPWKRSAHALNLQLQSTIRTKVQLENSGSPWQVRVRLVWEPIGWSGSIPVYKN